MEYTILLNKPFSHLPDFIVVHMTLTKIAGGNILGLNMILNWMTESIKTEEIEISYSMYMNNGIIWVLDSQWKSISSF